MEPVVVNEDGHAVVGKQGLELFILGFVGFEKA
jgi:hypothetical protein